MNQKTETLWCMHVIGPDDVHAAPSKEAAQRACDMYRARFAGKHDDVLLRFDVAEWPHSPESHAEDLKRWEKEILPLPANAELSGAAAKDQTMTTTQQQRPLERRVSPRVFVDGELDDFLWWRCEAYERALEHIRDDCGYGKESGCVASDVLRRWKAG